MKTHMAYYTYLTVAGNQLFTMVMLPEEKGTFPVVVLRTPYVDRYEEFAEDDVLQECLQRQKPWLEHGYAVVMQHCRGRGKSTGDCIPYIHEREDGLALQAWIREQSFYGGELYLKGMSYLTSVHYTTAPFADDVKGAIFSVQDSERYNICYRNGFLKKALHGSWYVGMYKAKAKLNKSYTDESFDLLPLKDFTKTVLGESAPDFDDMLKAPRPTDAYWQTHNGGSDARGATEHTHVPILFTTGFYDIYTGGMFDMWNRMSEETRNRSALVVSPYNHNDRYDLNHSIPFEQGKRVERFGTLYEVEWFEHIRNANAPSPFPLGQVTYYRLFENEWRTDSFARPEKSLTVSLGEDAVSYVYDPVDAPSFRGGLSCNFGGSAFQDEPGSRSDIISVYTSPFDKDTFVKGKMTARLSVASDCEDTCFYVRVSLAKDCGDFGLRDDITSLCYQHKAYEPNSEVALDFSFDEHAFLIQKGERLRIDIASADRAHYVRHTNYKGLFSEQREAKVARNTVFLQRSSLSLPVEEE